MHIQKPGDDATSPDGSGVVPHDQPKQCTKTDEGLSTMSNTNQSLKAVTTDESGGKKDSGKMRGICLDADSDTDDYRCEICLDAGEWNAFRREPDGSRSKHVFCADHGEAFDARGYYADSQEVTA